MIAKNEQCPYLSYTIKKMQLILILYLMNYLFAKCSARKIAKLSFLIFMFWYYTRVETLKVVLSL